MIFYEFFLLFCDFFGEKNLGKCEVLDVNVFFWMQKVPLLWGNFVGITQY